MFPIGIIWNVFADNSLQYSRSVTKRVFCRVYWYNVPVR